MSEFGNGPGGQFGTPLKTAILSLPQGSGKNLIADQLAQALGCRGVVDEWMPRMALTAGALHLTNEVMSGAA